MKKIILCILALFLTIGFTGCSAKTKEFYKKGVKVTLPSDFEEYEHDRWDFYVENDEFAIMSNRVSKLSNFTDTSGNTVNLAKLPLKAYMTLILASYNVDAGIYYVQGYNSTFYYCYYTIGEDYGYMMMVAETESFFYTINLCSDYDSFQQSKEKLFEYAISIQLD